MSRENGIPSFDDLFEDWLQEEFGDQVTLKEIGSFFPYEYGIMTSASVRHPNPFEPKFIGWIGDNKVHLYTGFSTIEVRPAEDPSLFEWVSKTIRSSVFYSGKPEISSIGEYDGKQNT